MGCNYGTKRNKKLQSGQYTDNKGQMERALYCSDR